LDREAFSKTLGGTTGKGKVRYAGKGKTVKKERRAMTSGKIARKLIVALYRKSRGGAFGRRSFEWGGKRGKREKGKPEKGP